MKRYTDEDVYMALEEAIEKAGSIRKLAAQKGLSYQYLSQVQRRHTPPSPRVAESLGFEDDGLRWIRSRKDGRAS